MTRPRVPLGGEALEAPDLTTFDPPRAQLFHHLAVDFRTSPSIDRLVGTFGDQTLVGGLQVIAQSVFMFQQALG